MHVMAFQTLKPLLDICEELEWTPEWTFTPFSPWGMLMPSHYFAQRATYGLWRSQLCTRKKKNLHAGGSGLRLNDGPCVRLLHSKIGLGQIFLFMYVAWPTGVHDNWYPYSLIKIGLNYVVFYFIFIFYGCARAKKKTIHVVGIFLRQNMRLWVTTLFELIKDSHPV